MAYEILSADDAVVCVRISDRMRLSDQRALQAEAAERIAKGSQIRLLVRLEDFHGWERGEGWEDVGFLMQHGDAIAKMAIVGDSRWKEEVFLFVGKGYRSTEIEYFAPGALSRAEVWVRT